MRSVGKTPIITGQQIKSLFKNPLKIYSQNLILLYNDAPERGVAFSIKKNICKSSVDRNRVKRLLRESFRDNEHLFEGNMAMFFISMKCGEDLNKMVFDEDMKLISGRVKK